MRRVAIFCGSKHGSDPAFAESAQELGADLAKRGIELVYGGGAVGLMGELAEAALSEGGRVIGVIPEKLYEMEVAHMGLTELYRVKTMHERKALMADLSDGFIALPGGIGTLEEIMEVITWKGIGYHNKPCGFMNVSGYYDDLLSFFSSMEKAQFLYGTISEQVFVETSGHELLDKMLDHSSSSNS